jgi:S-DNA-T family DNA segregation ATPase FtsK/SpoIIIE
VVEAGKASTSLLQRRLRIGYSKAARIMEEMEENGIIGAQDGSRPREVLISSLDELGEE